MKQLKLELNQLEYQSVQFALRWTNEKFLNAREYSQLTPALRRVLSNIEGLMDGKFQRVIGEKKYELDGDDLSI